MARMGVFYSKSEYDNVYLKSPHWRRLSEATKRQTPYCENNDECYFFNDISGSLSRDDSRATYGQDLHVDHLRYVDDEGDSILYLEQRDDLQVLCFKCHDAKHGKSREYLFQCEDGSVEPA
jgi:hypothetical protein